MFKRLYFLVITLFWVTMNALLWRSEIATHRTSGSPVRAASVWERILTAPDDSSLQLLHHGKKIGYCRWQAALIEPDTQPSDGQPAADIEGRVRQVAGYRITVDGSLFVGTEPQRLGFSGHLECDASGKWRTLEGQLTFKPLVWQMRADALAQTIELRSEGEGTRWERRFTFTELADPAVWLALVGGAGSFGTLGGLLPPGGQAALPPGALGLDWQARTDWHSIGHSRLRAYRLEARLLDRYRAVVMVSRVGEILRVELPDDLVMVNEALLSF